MTNKALPGSNNNEVHWEHVSQSFDDFYCKGKTYPNIRRSCCRRLALVTDVLLCLAML